MNKLNLFFPAAITCILLALWFSAAAADPFPWSQAKTDKGTLCLVDGTHIAYRSASILQGDRLEIAIALEWKVADQKRTQEIIHEMADSPPSLSAEGDLVKASWTVFPIGAEEESIFSTCWRLAPDRQVFLKSPCDAIP